MNVLGNSLPYDVNQRALQCRNGEVYWRVSYTGDAPLAIDRAALYSFARQLGLTTAEVSALLNTEAFPPMLTAPSQMPIPRYGSQWLHQPVIATLLDLASAKRNNAVK